MVVPFWWIMKGNLGGMRGKKSHCLIGTWRNVVGSSVAVYTELYIVENCKFIINNVDLVSVSLGRLGFSFWLLHTILKRPFFFSSIGLFHPIVSFSFFFFVEPFQMLPAQFFFPFHLLIKHKRTKNGSVRIGNSRRNIGKELEEWFNLREKKKL